MDKDLITRYLDPSTATVKGHMVRVQKRIWSTHSDRQTRRVAPQELEDLAPMQHMYSASENEMFRFAILQDKKEHTIYSDLTGRFPIESYTGMDYIIVYYVYKLNTVLLRTMKNREVVEMISAFKSCYKLNLN